VKTRVLIGLVVAAAVAVAFLATHGPPVRAQAVATITMPAPGGTKPLYSGCNNIGISFPDGTDSLTVIQAVTPVGAVDAMWRYNAALNKFEGYSPAFPQASDLLTVNFLDAVWLCMVEGLSAVAPPTGQVLPPPVICPGPPMVASFTATPNTIASGQSTLLSWGPVQDTDHLVIDQGIGEVAGSGSAAVSPAATTTYTMTATGCGGTSTYQVTVTVNPASANLEPVDLFIDWNDPNTPVLLTVENKFGDDLFNVTMGLTCTMERYPKGQVNAVPPEAQQTNSAQVSITVAWGSTTDVDTGFSSFDLAHHDYLVYCTISAVDFTDTSPLNSYMEVFN
jgi:hypothetical protein